MQARPDREARIYLHAGESLFVYLKAGTTIVSTAGNLELTGAPRWLGGELHPARSTLAEGEASLLEESGWLTLAAGQYDSSVSICRIETPLQPKDWLRRAASLFLPQRATRTCV